MLEKAISRGADALIIDFEDAVAMPEKAPARNNFAKWLEKVETEQQIWVRINADSILEDLEFANSSKITGIVVPKATIANLTQVAQSIGASMQISALIETADSILNAKSLAMVDKVSFLQIGVLDLRAKLGLSMAGDSVTLQYAFAQLVLAPAAVDEGGKMIDEAAARIARRVIKRDG